MNIDNSNVNTSLPGLYTVLYSATDSSGNTGNAIRSVSVAVDVPPIIVRIGGGQIINDIGNDYIEPGVTATDALGNNVQVQTSGNVDTNNLGDYTLTYTATDDYGNTSTMTRDVYVRDRDAPNININGDNTVILQLNSNYSELGATALDNHDENLSVQINDNIDTSIPGTYNVTYTATDSSGNTSSTNKTVIVENNIDPTINIQGDNPKILEVGNNYSEPGASSTDALGNAVNITTSDNIDKNTIGDYSVTYSATDSYGNTATSTKNYPSKRPTSSL